MNKQTNKQIMTIAAGGRAPPARRAAPGRRGLEREDRRFAWGFETRDDHHGYDYYHYCYYYQYYDERDYFTNWTKRASVIPQRP